MDCPAFDARLQRFFERLGPLGVNKVHTQRRAAWRRCQGGQRPARVLVRGVWQRGGRQQHVDHAGAPAKHRAQRLQTKRRLSHDGLCSPVATLDNDAGRGSYGVPKRSVRFLSRPGSGLLPGRKCDGRICTWRHGVRLTSPFVRRSASRRRAGLGALSTSQHAVTLRPTRFVFAPLRQIDLPTKGEAPSNVAVLHR